MNNDERDAVADITRQWMEQRFNRVDDDNQAIKIELVAVHEKVNQHAVYWAITKWVVVVMGSAGTSIAAWFGFPLNKS